MDELCEHYPKLKKSVVKDFLEYSAVCLKRTGEGNLQTLWINGFLGPQTEENRKWLPKDMEFHLKVNKLL